MAVSISPVQYLERRRSSDLVIEYVDSVVIEKRGESKAHGQIVSALSRVVGNALEGTRYDPRLGITVEAADAFLIPDLVVYRDGGDFTPNDDILRDPAVIFEVLSEPMTAYEHGKKWQKYQKIEPLMHYVIIWQNKPIVEVYTRDAAGDWRYASASGLDARIHLSHLDLTLALCEIYARVDFPEPSQQ